MTFFVSNESILDKKLILNINSRYMTSKNNYLGCVFEISNLNNCNKKYIETIKENFNNLNKEFSKINNTIILKLILKVDIKIMEFKDKEILFFKSIFKDFNVIMIYSYSNTMLSQLSSKRCCNMIVNVFSQDIIKKFDFIHHFNSGINHVILQEFKRNNLSLGVDISKFKDQSELGLSKSFSSCIQNSKLSTKAKIPQIIFNIINNELDIISIEEQISIQKGFFKAQPFQVQNQKNYFQLFFETQEKENNNEIVGFNY